MIRLSGGRLLWFGLILAAIWGGSLWWDTRRPLSAGGAAPEPMIPVLLEDFSGITPVPVDLIGRWAVFSADGRELYQGTGFRGMLRIDPAGILLGPYRLRGEEFRLRAEGDAAIQLDGRRYRGELLLELVRDPERGLPSELRLLLELPLEDYVVGVVCGEMPTSVPGIEEALRSQAILARTYALWRLSNGRRYLRDGPADQNFESVDLETRAGRAAATTTRGLVLSWQGELLPAYYHADCGGATVDSKAAGFTGSAYPPLRGVADMDCRRPFDWERLVSASRLDDFARRQELGEWLRRIQVTKRGEHGRLLEARVDGNLASRHFLADQLRTGLGTRSSFWHSLETRVDGALLIQGWGHGHGVGLCQKGALRRARGGAALAEILEAYYPGARVSYLADLQGFRL